MKIEIRNIRKSDYKKAIQFAVKGMHFDRYIDKMHIADISGILKKSEQLAPDTNDKYVSVLLSEIKDMKKKQQSCVQKIYIKYIDVIQKIFFKGKADLYENTLKEQLAHYLKTNTPDGEIIFLAADSDCKIKGSLQRCYIL